jgi:hypothetical protein
MRQKLKEWEHGHSELEEVLASKRCDLESRVDKAMLFIMPAFTRAMDHERTLLAKTAHQAPSGKTLNTVDELNDHLFVMVNAMANMAVTLVANAIKCDLTPICRDCLETRLSLLANVLSNVGALASGGLDRTEAPERFHS